MKVIFYEKPGCTNNTKQKQMLMESGHQVLAKSLLTERWTEERLKEFFGNKPVALWFNMAAPAIKSGELTPETFSEETALKAMIQDPLLIKRPLIETEEGKVSGFDNELVNKLINHRDTTGLHSCSNFLNRCS
jgi:nitrogenase-associated protein